MKYVRCCNDSVIADLTLQKVYKVENKTLDCFQIKDDLDNLRYYPKIYFELVSEQEELLIDLCLRIINNDNKMFVLSEHESNENVEKSRIEQTPKEIPSLCERCNNLSICKYVDEVSKVEENLKNFYNINLEDLPLGVYLYCSNHTNKDRNFE